ncbi:MAG: nucleotidyltransferase family protein [Sphingopyxis sp.]|nr:nucleotidyltransferase family protein [Sphingopyxis sp.]
MRDEAFFALLAVINPREMPTPEVLAERLLRVGDFGGWPILIEYAERHRVMPFFANRLRTLGWMEGTVFPLNADLKVRLEKTVRESAFAELASLAELKRICERLGDQGIAPILLKGLALSQLCFKKIGWRTNHDIDLLIRPDELVTCDRLLAEMNYIRVEPHPALDAVQTDKWRRAHKDWVYIHRSRRTIVEIHYRLFDNEPLCAEVDLSEVETLDLFGQHRILSLTGDALRSYLALHGLLHSWSRLKWLIDYELIRPVGGRDAGRDVATRVADRLGDTLFAAASAANGRGYSRTAMLVSSSLNAMAGGGQQELEQTKFGTTIKNMSHYLISLRPSYWLAELRYDLADRSRDGSAAAGRSGLIDRVVSWIRRKAGYDSGQLG